VLLVGRLGYLLGKRTISWLRAAADDRALVDRGQKNTERTLKALLGALGFEHVKVVFEEPPTT
jgi:hypothetical protein